MKKRFILSFLVVCLLCGIGIAFAAGGSESDPLISLSYLQDVFLPQVRGKITTALNTSDSQIRTAAEESLSRTAREDASFTASFREIRLSRDTTISGNTGSEWILSAGEAQIGIIGGTVVDVTDGTEAQSGQPMLPGHRYLLAEDTVAELCVTGKCAVVQYCGAYTLHGSNAPDYQGIADALHTLGGTSPLFRGTGSAVGSGYELERTPTRIEALIMLLRLLGEEDKALSCKASHPFTDVPDWCTPYVAYAYEKGYSNGIETTLFGTDTDTTAQMYVEFLLRTLGYSSTAQTDISTALSRAQKDSLLNSGEAAELENSAFLRADVAYLSYYALNVKVGGRTQTLGEKLRSAGVFTSEEYKAAQSLVKSSRIR